MTSTFGSCLSLKGDGRPWLWEIRTSQKFIIPVVGLTLFTDLFINGMIIPVMPEALVARARVSIQEREYWLSIILIVEASVSFLSAPLFGHLVDKAKGRGVQRLYLMGITMLILSMVLFVFAKSLPVYIFAKVSQGAAKSMVFIAGLTILLESSSRERMRYIFGYLNFFQAAGVVSGPVCGGAIYHYAGYNAVFGMALLLLLADIVLLLAIISEAASVKLLGAQDIGNESEAGYPGNAEHEISRNTHQRRGGTSTGGTTMWHLIREPRILISAASIFSGFLLISALQTTLPIFVEDNYHWDALGAGCVFVPVGVTIFLAPLFGALSDRFGACANAVIGFVLATPCLICLRFVQHNATEQKVIIFVLLFLIGACLNAVIPAVMAEMQNAIIDPKGKSPSTLSGNSDTGRACSLLHMAQCAGFTLGPICGGIIDHRYGWNATTVALGIVTGITAIPGLWLSGAKSKRILKDSKLDDEREPLLGSSSGQSSFTTFGYTSSSDNSNKTSFHTAPTCSHKNSFRGKSASMPLGHRFVTAAERPDLWHPTHSDPRNDLHVFPEWSQGAVLNRYYHQLGEIKELARYQTMIVRNSDERVIATGVCTPFFWPELSRVSPASLHSDKPPSCASTLPDGGWETILARGVLQARARRGERPSFETFPLTDDQKNDEATAWLCDRPNALSGLLVVVADNYRGQGLAGVLHQNFKHLARQNNLKALVIPVRPTNKTQYPHTPFEQYFGWVQGGPFRPGFTWPSSNAADQPLPFDRGIRKHVRMGAKAIKPAIRSFTVVASAEEWQRRLGDNLTLDVFFDKDGNRCVAGDKLDGLILEDEDQPTPLRWDPDRQVGIYSETDMWMWHQL